MTRRFRTGAALASVALALAAADASAQAAAARADTVKLRFGWPAESSARVATTRYQERAAESTDTTRMSADYRMSVTRHAEGLLVSYDDFSFPAGAAASGGMDLDALAARAASMVPKFVIGTGGDFLRLHDVQSVVAGLDSMMTEMLPPDEAAAARAAVLAMLSEEALTAMAADEWNAIVGMWVDADLEVGEVYALTDQAPIPIIPGAMVPMISEFTIEGRTSCVEGGAGRDCVEIHLVTYPDPDSVKAVLAKLMQSLVSTPGLGSIGFEALDVENEMVLITEPGTLRPHRVRLAKSVSGVVSADGERSEVSQLDVRTYLYSYER